MKKKNVLYYVLILICILIGSYIFPLKKTNLPNSTKNLSNDKPILVVRHFNNGAFNKLIMLNEILAERYKVIIDNKTEDYNLAVIGTFGEEEPKNQNAFKIFITGEAITPNIAEYDLSIGYNVIDNPHYFRIPYNLMMGKQYVKNRENCNPKKEFFACYLVTNGKYKEYKGIDLRDRIFHRLSLYKRVESAGSHLNNIGERLPYEKTEEFLSKCKFIIAYENQAFSGYITEKPYNAYNAGGVPIYYSALDAVKDINKAAIIFAPDFNSEEELAEYIIKVDNDDELYCKIWNEKLITNPEFNYEHFKEKLKEKLYMLMDEKEKLKNETK